MRDIEKSRYGDEVGPVKLPVPARLTAPLVCQVDK
ncbi:hypothetical protein FOTG_18619, partial [Fusarium oxysporum f. sp. vasinfectum 25433]